MTSLRWSPTAQAEVGRIKEFVAERDWSLAVKVTRTIQERARILRTYPKAGEPFGQEGLRKLSVVTYPDVIIYELGADHIEILRVHHAAQDWRPR